MGNFDGTYDPQKQDLIVDGIPIVGIVEGTFVKATRDEAGFIKKKGADGRGARSRSANKGGKITFTLMNTSPSNDRLQALATLDEQTGEGVVTTMVKDRTSKAGFVHAEDSWIEKIPDYERAKEIGDIEWTIDCDDLEIVNSGLSTAVGP